MYNLTVLNDKEFEFVAKDILESIEKISLQVFKKGRDKGIDLRYASDRENKIVVQAKHYIGSNYSSLKHILVHEERAKISTLIPLPERYILFTSLSLSVAQVDELLSLLAPYIKNSNDIWGQERICEAIRNNPKIEEKHSKLWLASSNVLKTIINNGIKGRSEFYSEKIFKRLQLYVPTKNYQEAIKKLNVNRFLIVTGEPGVGKTTISYLIICGLLAQGFELIYVNDKIAEAENVLSTDPEVKQVVYFDDFLGSNIAEIINPRNTESAILGLIERITNLKNKFLILTTRTTILNQAKNSYEKLVNSNYTSISKYQVEIGFYTRLAKAKILYNHLYHSKSLGLQPEYYQLFVENKNYLKIIDHRNFSPRLIEFLTSKKTIDPSEMHIKKILAQLDNPVQVWKGAYESQLGDEDRFLLTTLFSIGGYNVSQSNLAKAYNARLRYEIANNGFKLENDSFNRAIKKLLDGFISAKKDVVTHLNAFSFLNPSVGDFILNYLRTRPEEKWRILHSVIFFEQITHFFYPKRRDVNYIPFDKDELAQFYELFHAIAPSLQSAESRYPKSKPIEIIKIYTTFFTEKITKELLEPWVNQISHEEITANQFYDTLEILPRLIQLGFKSEIVNSWEKLVNNLLQLCDTPDEFAMVKLLFNQCYFDLNKFFEKEENRDSLRYSLSIAFTNSFKEDPNISDEVAKAAVRYSREGHSRYAEDEIYGEAKDQYHDFIGDSGFSDIDGITDDDLDIDTSSILSNLTRNYEHDNDDYDGGFHSSDDNGFSDAGEIDRLFE